MPSISKICVFTGMEDKYKIKSHFPTKNKKITILKRKNLMKRKRPEELDRIIKRINVIEKNRPSHKEILQFVKNIIREQYKIQPLIKVEPIEINQETERQQMGQ